jgi:hypothetical protein
MSRANQSRDFPNGSEIGEDGRAPEPPDPAYQQILKGVPAADFSADELLYLPRNLSSHRLCGMSPVEQIALTVNIALRRDAATTTTTAPAPRQTPSPRSPRNGPPTRSARSRIISTR